MGKGIKNIHGINLSGYRFSCSRYVIKAVATKEELMVAIKLIDTVRRVKSEIIRELRDASADSKFFHLSDYWIKWRADVRHRRAYIHSQYELKGLYKVWRNRYTDGMNADNLYSPVSLVHMDFTTGEYGSFWTPISRIGHTHSMNSIAKNTTLLYSRHTPTGDVEFVSAVDNESCILKRGSTMAEKIRIIPTE